MPRTGSCIAPQPLDCRGLPTTIVEAPPPTGAGADDLLDALACAAIARRIHAGQARPFPDPPKRDTFGLPIAIWA
jgi:predicted RNase H-like nuclease